MTLTATEVWTRILDRARHELPEQTFRTWLEPTEPLSLEGDTIVVGDTDDPTTLPLFGDAVHYELLCRRHFLQGELGI